MRAVAIKLPVGEIFLHLSGKSGVLRRKKSEEEGLGTKVQPKKTRTTTFLDKMISGSGMSLDLTKIKS